MKTVKFKSSYKPTGENFLTDILNYKSHITNTYCEIVKIYITILNDYMNYIAEKLTQIKNTQQFMFIFNRGIDTISHVFGTIYYYTKNIELTQYHTQKAFYFYVEYIEQINDETIMFLKLSSKDAIMFVYRKTIFEINTDYKKQMPEPIQSELLTLNSFTLFMESYKNILHNVFKHDLNHMPEIQTISLQLVYIFPENLAMFVNNTLLLLNTPAEQVQELTRFVQPSQTF